MAGPGPHGADDSPVGLVAGVKGRFFLRGAGVTPTCILGEQKEQRGAVDSVFPDQSHEAILEGSPTAQRGKPRHKEDTALAQGHPEQLKTGIGPGLKVKSPGGTNQITTPGEQAGKAGRAPCGQTA